MSRKLVCFVFVLGLVLTSTTSAADSNLVGWWTFDGHALDISGNDHHGMLHGNPGFGPGVYGQALELQGTPDYVTMDGYEGIVGAHAFSITVWIKTSVTGEIQEIVHFGTQTGGQRCEFRVHSNGLIRMGPGNGRLEGLTLVNDGEWHHIAVTIKESATSSSSDVRIYLDGVDDTEEGHEDTDPYDFIPEWDVTIGYRLSTEERPFIGSIDDVRIYDKVLIAEEIQQIMLSGGEPYPFASSPDPVDGAMIEDTWVNLSWSPGALAVSHDVYLGENFDDVNAGAESTFQGNQATTTLTLGFPGFAYPDGLVPGTTYYWRIDEVNDTEPNSPWKGKIWSFSIPPKTAYFPNPADGAESVDPNADLGWTAGFGSKLHTVYFGENFNDVNDVAGGLPQGTATYDPGPLELAKTYYWRVDEFDAVDTHKGNIWYFTTEGAVGSPDPAKGAVDVTQTPVLTWVPGVFADSHEVYFGTNADAVKNTDTSSPEFKGSGNLGSESYEPGQLEWDTTYYWRIDEANNANADSPWKGNVWSFTTANFLVVDDFESYNDLNPDDPNSNRIFMAWLDGFDNPATNGSVVGHAAAPFAEQTIVHGGLQSMPLAYDNAVGKSEATLTLTDQRDWTVNGVNTLTIWFRGEAANAAENLYVALNGNAVVTHGNPDAAQRNAWIQWNIDLQAFADQGVNLANVNTITLGLGNKTNPVAGGAGMMYFDDIRLYAPEP